MTKLVYYAYMATNNDIFDLEKLGFSQNDAMVYLALVELGTSTSNPIISKTGLHRSIVYTSLEHLVARKLVAEKEIKGKKTFSAVSPSLLVEEFAEKHRLADQIAGEISQKLKADTREITIHQGNEEYLSLLVSLLKSLPKGGTKYVLGTGGEDFMKQTMLPIWRRYHKVAHAQNIKIKMIGYESQRFAIEPHTKKEGNYEVKYLPSEMENPAGIHIYPEADTVLNIIYSDEFNPVTAIKIKNKAFVRSHLNLFNSLWQKGAI